MTTKVYQLYASVAASTNSAAAVIAQRDGYITGWHIGQFSVGQADANASTWELSFASTYQGTVNDAVGPLDSVSTLNSNSANGVMQKATDSIVSGVAIPIRAGDRLYMHYAGSSVATQCFTHVYVSEK